MDIGVKERVIGAVVLVVLGIIIIPWVLQGPAPESTVTRNVPLPAASTAAAPAEYRMDLTGQAPQVPVTSAPQPAAQSAPPVSGVAAPDSSAGTEKTQAPVVAAATPKKISPVERKREVPAAGGGWLVQAGSYGSEPNALKLQKTLEKHGYRVLVSRYQAGNSTYYRVRVGPYSTRAAAEQVIPAINRLYGGKAKVVPNS